MTSSPFAAFGRSAGRCAALMIAGLLAACANKPAAPDWQINAFAALRGFSTAFLNGNSRLAELEMARARSEIAGTGRADLLARAELTYCAVRAASLEFDNCASYQPLAQDAGPQERAYAAFLSGRWTGIDASLLPERYRVLATNAAAASSTGVSNTLGSVADPLSRLVAAGVLLQTSDLSPAVIAIATETASGQGWRRPLLAWLGLQFKRAADAGDADAAARVQRRINMVLQKQD
ncbi:MAG: hypothetical protein ACOYNZ_01660 [Rhodoferax sp.]